MLSQLIGEILISRGKLDPVNLERALQVQETMKSEAGHEKLGSVLMRLGMVSGRDLAEALALQHGWIIADPAEFPELPILEDQVLIRFFQALHLAATGDPERGGRGPGLVSPPRPPGGRPGGGSWGRP